MIVFKSTTKVHSSSNSIQHLCRWNITFSSVVSYKLSNFGPNSLGGLSSEGNEVKVRWPPWDQSPDYHWKDLMLTGPTFKYSHWCFMQFSLSHISCCYRYGLDLSTLVPTEATWIIKPYPGSWNGKQDMAEFFTWSVLAVSEQSPENVADGKPQVQLTQIMDREIRPY